MEDAEREIEEVTPEDDEEIKVPTTTEMGTADMWVHAKENILKNGRTLHLDPEDDGTNEEFDAEEAKKALEASDPYEPRLKRLSADGPIKVSAQCSVPAWQVFCCGERTEFTSEKDPKKTVSNGVAVVRSNVWPGAYSFYYQSQVYQVYLGNGHKFEPVQSVHPCHPPLVMQDCNEYDLEFDPREEIILPEEPKEAEEGEE